MTTSKDKKKKIKLDKVDYDADLILSRVLLLLGTHQIDLKDIFKFELASFPASLFDEFGNARYPKISLH